MNKVFLKLTLIIPVILFCISFRVLGQVTPTTADVNLFCEGADLTFPPPAANENWIVKYSTSQTTTPATVISLVSGDKIPAADLKTGYYYLSAKSTAAGACESDMQEIPVYVLKPLVPSFVPANFCVESPLAQLGSVVNPEDPLITQIAYQWYSVSGGVETILAGENSKDFTPVNPTVGTTTYRLKVGYIIGGNKYCAQTIDHDITVSPKPGKPNINSNTIQGTAGAVTF
ncbi:hypothetical protein [Pedobacter rhizosphaerae]|uniref:Uncharacterized protein n=1 Tax=Pedobacter rhizosphaerae TaxID=390241 RepID=A0A1H9VCI3_9SPHI|nr:hypothetical protein [Pedobacter rhizosphaerae]SES18983.1 hypothetical protein SAMN04488023_14038 [Pedobacter rhizosphaerae]